MKKTHSAITGKGSPLKKYQEVMVGSNSIPSLLYFEWCMLLAPIPGALGMLLRKVFWPSLFGSCCKGCMFGANIVLRHPNRIHLGRSVVISEGCVLDGRHGHEEQVITLGDNVILSNTVMLSCKNGTISIGNDVGINAQTIVQSTNGCPVTIGDDCILGQRCFVIGGGTYNIDRLDIPIREQGIKDDGGVTIADNVWLGGNVTVLGGVSMGAGSVVAAGGVVTASVESNTINMGVPAKVIRTRTES